MPDFKAANKVAATEVLTMPIALQQASANPEQVQLNMAGPKAGRQRMAIAAEGAAAQSQVEIVRAAKPPEVLAILGRSASLKLASVDVCASTGGDAAFVSVQQSAPATGCAEHIITVKIAPDTCCHGVQALLNVFCLLRLHPGDH